MMARFHDDPLLALLRGLDGRHHTSARRWLVFALLMAVSAPHVADAKPCPRHAVYGLIGERYKKLGGSDGPLGCPLSDEQDTPGARGRYNDFEFGQIVYSPGTGPRNVVSAYWKLRPDGRKDVQVEWGDMSPFHYDFFLVRPTRTNGVAGDELKDQWEIRSHGSSGSTGLLSSRLAIGCNEGLTLHFSATDGTPNPRDLTGVLYSNTLGLPCP